MHSAMKRMTSWSRLLATAAVLATASLASAGPNVLMMPDRPAFTGTPVVVWGNTSFATGSTYTIDFGDGTAAENGNVTDPTYIATTHTYGAPGAFGAKLTVTDPSTATDSETATITVSNAAALNAFDLREAKVDMAIEDGLRWLYVNQANRSSTPTTSWSLSGYRFAGTSLAALAFQDHGHLITIDPAKRRDIYQDVVQRAVNFIVDQLGVQVLDLQITGMNPAGNDPCVGPDIEARPCNGLQADADGLSGYNTSLATLAVAAAAAVAPDQTIAAGLGSRNGNLVEGKKLSEVLQRLIDTVAWGQNDGGNGEGGVGLSCQEGGFQYSLNFGSDGSAIGWAVLALFDGAAAGATVPPFIAMELANVVAQTSCTMGPGELALSYASCYMPGASCCFSPGSCDGSLNVAKAGVLLQALNFMGVPQADPRVQGAMTYISNRWESNPDQGYFYCHNSSGDVDNKGCGYGMFNTFKGLKLYGIDTLPGVMRPAGPLNFPAHDWYEDYRDFLVANQSTPTDPMGGNWMDPGMHFSSQTPDTVGGTALAEIILSPTALILPTTLTLSPQTANNPVGTQHTVTATATSAKGSPVPAATVEFKVISGPDVNDPDASGRATTDSNGQATFTYTNNGTAGTDQIQASIGNLLSNVVSKTWGSNPPPPQGGEICGNCIDDDGDGLVDFEDPDCCKSAANLEVTTGTFKGIAKKGRGRLRLHTTLGAIGITEQTPLSEDTTIQFRNGNGELLCANVGHQHWMRMHGDSKFWDRSGQLAKGLQDGTIRVKKDGTIVFRTFSNIMDLSRYDQSRLTVTVRVGNKCSRGSVQLRQKKGKLIFP